jgi:hypothetical protein
LQNPLAPIIVGGGFVITINSGIIVVGTVPTLISQTVLSLTPSASNFIFVSSTGVLTINTSGFVAGCMPIATIVTDALGIHTITDNRPDFTLPIAGAPGGAASQIQFNSSGAFGGIGALTPAGTAAPNPKFLSLNKNFTSTGNSDIYTCPANRRAIVVETTIFNGNGASSSIVTMMVKIGSVYYPISPSVTITAQLAGTRSTSYVLEAGEVFAVNSTQQPLNVIVSGMEFDNTANIKTAKVVTPVLQTGDNTIYTCPNGKSALVLNNTLTMASATVGTLNHGNGTIGTITSKFNVVTSGGSVSASNQITPASVINPGVASNFTTTGFCIGAGDFISLNLSAGTSDQIGFVTVVEI